MGLREKALTELEAERKMMKIAAEKVRQGLLPGPAHSGEPSIQSLEGPEVEGLQPGKRPKQRRIFSKPNSGYLVIIRHGKTGYNKLKLFTGWEDVPLAPEGHLEAEKGGKLLFQHGFKLDMVFTSWLSRAIETAWHVMDNIGDTWIPVVKTWRLNERMYGDLEGLSKQMTKQRYGEAQFKQWRRGYDTPPPAASPFSPSYPGNDDRYRKYVTDLPISFRQSFIRSIAHGRLELHRRLPQSESLKDCMSRTIPYYTDHIVPEAIDKGKNVMIASSENAIRGLLMYLLDIPSDQISGLEIPTGVPLIFDMKGKCLKLLDDGLEPSPYERLKFGKLKEKLFTPQTDDPDVIRDPVIRIDDERYDWPDDYDGDVCSPFVTLDDRIIGFAELPEDCEGPPRTSEASTSDPPSVETSA
jgi:2,3-bisphosphoglycerate-dependent phosphoglycerate mutase